MIDHEAIIELQQILVSDYGEKIDKEEVEKIATRLIATFESIVFDDQATRSKYEIKRPTSIPSK
jgi:hypothetical protein